MPFFTSSSSSSAFPRSIFTSSNSHSQYQAKDTHQVQGAYQPINIIITPATPHLPPTPRFGQASTTTSIGSSTSTSTSTSSSTATGSSGLPQRCARVLNYDNASSGIEPTRRSSCAGMGSSSTQKFFGYQDVDHKGESEMDLDLEDLELQGMGGGLEMERVGLRSRREDGVSSTSAFGTGLAGFSQGTSTSHPMSSWSFSSNSTSSNPNSNRTKLNLLACFLALFLASLGVVSVMIPDLVSGLSGRYSHEYDYAPSSASEHDLHVHVDLGVEGLHGLSSGRSTEGLKVRGEVLPLHPALAKRAIEGGRWGFSMDWVGRPTGFNPEESEVDIEEPSTPIVPAPDVPQPRPHPEVKVVQVEQVQRMLLQQSKDRLRRRQETLQARV